MKKIYLFLFILNLTFIVNGQKDATFLNQNVQLKSNVLSLSSTVFSQNSVVDLGNQIIYNFSGKIDTFTVPENVNKIIITAIGAAGGTDLDSDFPGGFGALVSGEFDVIPGEKLKLLVGENPARNGGGGGSFVTDLLNNPLIIAGGGGGSGELDSPEKHGSITESGGKGGGTGGDGGMNGNGGLANGSGYQSGAGGGFFTNGANGNSPMIGGTAFVNGGIRLLTGGYGDGGFGGGGTGSGYVVGGGGGGYSGGGAAGNGTGGGVGGGGASFNTGNKKNFIAQHNSGHGQIIIELIENNTCPGNITIENDSGKCGVIVDYTVTAPEKGSFVQTAGLPTGSEFPVGTTTNCFLLTDSLGVESTCCFTVTVVDSIAPTFNCLPDITVPADSGKDCAQVYFNTNAIISGVAQEGITLGCGAGTPLGVAYNPLKELYYTTGGGYNQAGLLTFDKNGNLLHDNYAGFDFRGLWWNPNINSLEGNGFGNYSGYRTVDLDANGYALSTGVNNPVGLNQPDEQSIGDYDYELNQVVFYNNGKIYKYDRNTGTLIETLDITGLPGSFSNLNVYFAGFSGVKGAEIVVLDYVTKQVYFIDKTTGIFSTSVQLPSSAPTNYYYMTSIANGHIWIADNTVWHSYKIFDEGKVVDNCGNVDISFSTASGTCFPIGETKVTMTATDDSGNSSVCEFTVTVEARENPAQLYCNPIDVTLDEFGKYKLDNQDILDITGRTIDSLTTFNDLKIYAYPDTFSCANTEWPVFVRITEYNGNHKKERCWAMVTVHDFTPPTITGNNIELSLDETGQAILTTQMVTDSTVFDACGIDTISLDKSIFTCDDLGENTVILTAVDIHGNIAADTILVTITDSQVPVVAPVADLEITAAPGVCWTTIEYPVPVINDNCTYTLTQTGGLGPDAQFPIGTTTESWIVTDAGGNSAEIEFNVIIVAGNALPTFDTPSEVTEDEDTPEIIIPVTGISYGNDCKAQTVELTAVSDNNELISDIEVSYTDGESEAELKLTIAPDMNGTAKVTLTVKDEMDGMIYKTFNVTILPVNDAPVVVKPVEDQIVNASYVLKVPVSSALGELFDDVDGDVLKLTAMMENGTPLPAWAELIGDELICSPMIEDKGNYTLVVKATDPDGASATDTFVVVVDGYPVSTPSIDAGFDIAMYPNPTAGRVQIELKNSGSKIEIAVFSITGSEVFRNTYYNTHLINLNMNEKGSGVYLVKMNIDGNNIVKKLVVDKK